VVAKVALMSGSASAGDLLRGFDSGGMIVHRNGDVEVIDNGPGRGEWTRQ
jgi:hypothetical protein